MASSSSPASVSLFGLLATVLPSRSTNSPLEEPGYEKENLAYVEGLLRVLEQDVAAGHLPTPLPSAWLEMALFHLVAPRKQPAVVPSFVRWPDPSEPWQVPEGADLREQLLARLIHMGIDPWQAPSAHYRHFGATLACGLLTHGYHNVMRQALSLPQADTVSMGEGSGYVREGKARTLLQEAVWQDQHDLVTGLLTRGSAIEGALRLANSSKMVSRLLAAGARLEDVADPSRYKDVCQEWLATRPAAVARELIAAAQDRLMPAARLETALSADAWGPVKDALEGFDQWRSATRSVGALELPLAIALIVRARRTQDQGSLRHGLRLLALNPATEDEVAPGLTQTALLRLSLAALLASGHAATQSETALQSALEKALVKLLPAQAPRAAQLDIDAACFLAASEPMRGTAAVRRISAFIATGFHLLPAERGVDAPTRFAARTHGDLSRLGQLARLMVSPAKRADMSDDTHVALFGVVVAAAYSDPTQLKRDHRYTWLSRLASRNTQRTPEVMSGALWLLALSCWSGDGLIGGSGLQQLRESLSKPVIEGAAAGQLPDMAAPDLELVIRVLNDSRKAPVAIQALLPRLTAQAQAQRLEQDTAPAITVARAAGPRL